MFNKDELNKILSSYDKYFKGEFLGCTIEEINKLEDELQVRFPLAYRNFLSMMGKESADVFNGLNIHLWDIKDIQKRSKKFANENQINLPNKIIAIANNQDYAFLYFELSGDEDPCVYQMVCGDAEPTNKLEYNSLSEFIIRAFDAHIRAKMYLQGELLIPPIEGIDMILKI